MKQSPRGQPTLADLAPALSADPTGTAKSPRIGAIRETRPLPAGIEPLLAIADLAVILSCSRRLVERMRSSGRVPEPDFHVGRCPRWKPETIRRWIEAEGCS